MAESFMFHLHIKGSEYYFRYFYPPELKRKIWIIKFGLKIRLKLRAAWWLWKNRSWRDCRHKRKRLAKYLRRGW